MNRNNTDTLDLLVDIKGILRSCPRNSMDATILQSNNMAEALAEKSVQILRNVLGEIQSCDHVDVMDKILKKLKESTT